MTIGDELIAFLRAEHKAFADRNRVAARGQEEEDKIELRAETTGHNIMLFTATKAIRQMMETTNE